MPKVPPNGFPTTARRELPCPYPRGDEGYSPAITRRVSGSLPAAENKGFLHRSMQGSVAFQQQARGLPPHQRDEGKHLSGGKTSEPDEAGKRIEGGPELGRAGGEPRAGRDRIGEPSRRAGAGRNQMQIVAKAEPGQGPAGTGADREQAVVEAGQGGAATRVRICNFSRICEPFEQRHKRSHNVAKP